MVSRVVDFFYPIKPKHANLLQWAAYRSGLTLVLHSSCKVRLFPGDLCTSYRAFEVEFSILATLLQRSLWWYA